MGEGACEQLTLEEREDLVGHVLESLKVPCVVFLAAFREHLLPDAQAGDELIASSELRQGHFLQLAMDLQY